MTPGHLLARRSETRQELGQYRSMQSAGESSRQAQEKVKSFSGLGLSSVLVRSLASLRVTTPTPIQNSSIPLILSGCDLIGGSPTGSGKTLSFALPILQRLSQDMVGGYAVILTPTRELALQLYEQFVAVGEGAKMGLRVALVLGGLDMMKQATELSKSRPHIIVATPGRLVDIIKSGGGQEWGLERCKFVVLDEADRLLTATFGPELSYLFSVLPPARARQTLLFTATLTEEIEALASKEPEEGEKKPVLCQIEQSTSTPATLDQRYLFVPSHVKEPYLYHLVTNPPIETARRQIYQDEEDEVDEDDELLASVPFSIIFVAKSQTAALLSHMLKELGIDNVSLHSNLSQPQRMESLSTFRSQSVPVLITTDLGSRGLDVPDVEMVINWDLPRDWRDYIHRVGRTARNGKSGLAINFVCERDIELFKGIEDVIKVTMEEIKMNEEKVLEKLNAVMTARRLATMHLHDTHFGQRKQRNEAKLAMKHSPHGKHRDQARKKKSKKTVGE